MYSLKIRLAGKNIIASVIYPTTERYCRDYLADFDTADVTVAVSESDIAAERAKNDRERILEGLPPVEVSDAYLETLSLYRKIAEALIDFGIILFHGSAIAVDGETYLFTATSGTGKSTHTRLWRETFGDRAVMVNDDKPLIEIRDTGATIYGTPWNGKHRLGSNVSLPLKAICILERAEKNRITELDPKSEFPKIFSQTYRKSDGMFMAKTLSLLDKLLSVVKVYKLGCNMELEAALVSYNGMKGNDKNEA